MDGEGSSSLSLCGRGLGCRYLRCTAIGRPILSFHLGRGFAEVRLRHWRFTLWRGSAVS